MANIFSAAEVVEMGIEIEKNGRDFYSGVARSSKTADAKEAFLFLGKEEEKHIKRFEEMLSQVKKYEPQQAYPGEYFAYIRTLSGEHVFTKRNKGTDIAKNVKGDSGAVDLGIGFEKDSILFYEEMKKFVLEGEQKVIDKLLEEEKGHLRTLMELKKKL